ncbi:alpha/beta hydrolase [Nocardioides bruguierae]|uniref:alpha/beta hydrolase n=1 Tax=Nocardioides bruguierae TaxID=2945102 RepID=UPI0020210AE5|nr:serine esterase [Nocardioides bruguierae]MCL8024085.1 serine esterase [Nocardioides bruguierae]
MSAAPVTTLPVAVSTAEDDAARPLVVLLHGRGADERSIIGLARHLPAGASYVALRAPLGAEQSGYAWFANHGIGRPDADSLAGTMAWFDAWLASVAEPGRPVVLVGFSGGAAFAGGLLLTRSERWAGVAVLAGTLPFEPAGMDLTTGRLAGSRVLVAQGSADHVIPRDLLDRTRTWLADESGADVTVHTDDGGHGLTAQGVTALAGWLEGILTAS